jgi:type II secretory pathway pseudopilin PulG
MRRVRLVLGLVLLLTVAALLRVGWSGAVFSSASNSTVSVSVAGATSLLRLYSQSSDPDGLTGYFVQRGGSTPAATGTDKTLSVNLGTFGTNNTTCNRVFTIKAPSSFPSGVTSITVTATVSADPTTGAQPINSFGFAAVNNTARNNPVTLTAGQKMQCNLRVQVPRPSGTVYRPTLTITMTYTGYSGSFFQYSVPISMTSA